MTIPVPEFEWTEEVSTSVMVTDPAYGAVMRGRTRDSDVRRFHLTWKTATQAMKDDLTTEYTVAKGGAGTTTYTPAPMGGGSVTVRFVDWTPPTMRGGPVWEMACVLEEELTPY
jgi:hypothetical protein